MANIRIILAFLAVTALLLAFLQRQGATLVNGEAPYGIVSLELAGDAEKASAIAAAWEAEGKTAVAIRNIRLDFLLIPFYSILLYMACGSLATYKPSRHGRIGAWIAFACLLAGIFDVFENLAMMAALRGRVGATGAAATTLLASAKFAILAIAVLYILSTSARRLLRSQGKQLRTA
jgi:hypothetical protein